jgi:hypothetical protein
VPGTWGLSHGILPVAGPCAQCARPGQCPSGCPCQADPRRQPSQLRTAQDCSDSSPARPASGQRAGSPEPAQAGLTPSLQASLPGDDGLVTSLAGGAQHAGSTLRWLVTQSCLGSGSDLHCYGRRLALPGCHHGSGQSPDRRLVDVIAHESGSGVPGAALGIRAAPAACWFDFA